jgi:hypothetical protein
VSEHEARRRRGRVIGLIWAIRRWRAYRIDRWTEAHPPPRLSRVVV